MGRSGILVIRSDIAADVESDYLAWLSREHAIERVGIDGFLSARMFRGCRSAVRRYLILYDLENPAVIDSDAYLRRLDNPTPWSARMMPRLGAFVRGGGAVTESAGSGSGTALLPLVIDDPEFEMDQEAVDALARMPEIVAVRLVQTDARRTTAPTRERRLRARDDSFDRLLLIESLSVQGALAAAAANVTLMRLIGESTPADAAYQEIFHLAKADLPR